jgi:hypothetical protein
MKFKNWNNEDLKGIWQIFIKIDGVRCHKIEGKYFSRNNKLLYNIPEFDGEVAEIYCGSFKDSIINTRTSSKEMTIKKEHIYELLPNIDKRLVIGIYENPSKEFINSLLQEQLSKGNEGLILLQDNKRIKVKSCYSEDVLIKGFIEGNGKYVNTLGAIMTEFGNVGTGLTDEDRNIIWNNKETLLDTYIEVEFMEKTPDNKFRHPRFKRLRPDK